MMKYACLNCKWVSYRDGAKDGYACNCGGKLDPLGWEENGATAPCAKQLISERENRMFKQTCSTTGSLYEAMKALDVLGKEYTVTKRLVVEKECHVGEGPPLRRLIPMGYPEWTVAECEPESKEVEASPGSLQIKVDVDTSSVQEAMKDVERLTESLAELESQPTFEKRLDFLDRLIQIASILPLQQAVTATGFDAMGRIKVTCNAIQDELGLKIGS